MRGGTGEEDVEKERYRIEVGKGENREMKTERGRVLRKVEGGKQVALERKREGERVGQRRSTTLT